MGAVYYGECDYGGCQYGEFEYGGCDYGECEYGGCVMVRIWVRYGLGLGLGYE